MDKGPNLVFGSTGSPVVNVSISFINSLINSSYTFSSIINLLAAIHTYPAFNNFDVTPNLAANFKSASWTIKGSAPPNSRTHRLTCFPAIYAIFVPAFVDPVNDTPATLGSPTILSIESTLINVV